LQFTAQKYNTITKENINEMVVKFYTKILEQNNEVTKVFQDKLGPTLDTEHWVEHIEILTNFWAMIALEDEAYNGNPMRAHFDLPLTRDMFGDWLMMFFSVVDSMYEDRLGMIFKQRAQNIAGNFMRNLRL
jgi:hemoglobin